MHRALKVLLLMLFLILSEAAWGQSGQYTVTGDKVNVRSGPGTNYPVIGSKKKGDTVVVLSLYDNNWARIQYVNKVGYISRHYIVFSASSSTQKGLAPSKKPQPKRGFWDTMYEITKAILLICAIIIVVGGALNTEWGSPAVLLQIICGIGAIIGGIVFHNARIGASVGMMIGLAMVLVFIMTLMDLSAYGWITYILWYVISLPFYLLDMLQFWLAKPWRPFMKTSNLTDEEKKGWREALPFCQIPFYILCFPLRFINAVYYNLIIHNIYELSNYILEVFAPSDDDEGRESWWLWLIMFPVRFFKYIIIHWNGTLIESIFWTVVDTFIPAVTLYHGTAEGFAENMLSDPERTGSIKRSSNRKTGVWNVGGGNYAGDGIYFGIFRKTLRNYEKGSAIVARVTMGKTIDTVLMPKWVYSQAGKRYASEVSNWGLRNGYVSGEWWREDGEWWEICMYDRKNRYNDSWRIRPIYAISSNSGIMQRVPGGTAHWLFRDMVVKDLWRSIKNIFK